MNSMNKGLVKHFNNDYSFISLFRFYLAKFLWHNLRAMDIRDNDIAIYVNNIRDVVSVLRHSSFFRFTYLVDFTYYEIRSRDFVPFLTICSPLMNYRVLVSSIWARHRYWWSFVSIYAGNNWLEREVYDMFGIIFLGHPSLRRILVDYGDTYHPLKHAFPTSGVNELYYNPLLRSLTYRKVDKTAEDQADEYNAGRSAQEIEELEETAYLFELKSFFYYPIEFVTTSMLIIDFYKEFSCLLSFFAFFSTILTVLLLLSYLFTTFLRGIDLFTSRWYECGFDSLGTPRGIYDLRFFRLIVLFVLYDLELLYILPWLLIVMKMEYSLVSFILLFFLFLFLMGLVFVVEVYWRILKLDEKNIEGY